MSENAEFTITWVIENFKLFPAKNGVKLESPELLLKHFDNTNWCLQLYPGGYESDHKEHVSVYLHRSIDDGPEKIEVVYTLLINGKKNHSIKYSFKSGVGYGYTKFMRLNEVKQFAVLVVECHMQIFLNGIKAADYKNESKHSFIQYFNNSQFMISGVMKEKYLALEQERSATLKALRLYSNQSFVRTRVSVEKRILLCEIMDYLGPESKRKQHIPVAFPSATIMLTLFMSEKNKSDLLEIEICAENRRNLCCMLICKIELTDSERNIHITSEEEHLFEDNKTWIFEQPLQWKDVKGKKEPTLRFTLTFSDGQHFSDIEWSTGVDDCGDFLNFSNKLIVDLHRMFTERKLCDVEIQVQDKSFDAHKIVLYSRSPVFAAMFESGMKENSANVIEIDDLDSNTVNQMLLFMYTGIIEEVNTENARKLFSAADKYEIDSLKDICRNILKKHLTLETICSVLSLADTHQDDQLLDSCITFVSYHRKDILESPEWKELEEKNVSLANDILKKLCMKLFP